MITNLHHISLAVRNVDVAVPDLQNKFGAKFVSKDISEANSRIAAHLELGSTHIVLMEPLGEGGEIAKFLESRGEGIHSVTFEVDDLEKSLETLTNNGARVVYRGSAFGYNFAFIHPKDCFGLMIELAQKAE